MIESVPALILGCLALLALCFLLFKPKAQTGLQKNEQVNEYSSYVGPNKILTPSERVMFAMLTSSTPSNYKVLCQVSFNAFLKCDNISLRNAFNRSMCDFLIVDENFIPVLCLELDDNSHTRQSVIAKDKFRDDILSAAHIPTERFVGLPSSENELKNKISHYFKNHKKSMVYKKLIRLR